MAETCPTCLLPLWFDGIQFQHGVHCPGTNPSAINGEDVASSEADCLRLGVEARDAQLAEAKALNDRSRLALITLRDKIDQAITQTAPGVEGG